MQKANWARAFCLLPFAFCILHLFFPRPSARRPPNPYDTTRAAIWPFAPPPGSLSPTMHPLQGKVVLITGGSSGIGRATALRLAGHGARVVVAARTTAALEQVVREAAERGAEALAVPTDVTEREQCRRAVAAAVERFGRLDVLVCSAGVSMRALFADSDLDVLEGVVRVNFL